MCPPQPLGKVEPKPLFQKVVQKSYPPQPLEKVEPKPLFGKVVQKSYPPLETKGASLKVEPKL